MWTTLGDGHGISYRILYGRSCLGWRPSHLCGSAVTLCVEIPSLSLRGYLLDQAYIHVF
jgi:hypothetical protein